MLWQVHLGDAAPGGANDDLPLGALHSPAPLPAALSAVGYVGTAAFDLDGAVSGPNWTGMSACMPRSRRCAGDRAARSRPPSLREGRPQAILLPQGAPRAGVIAEQVLVYGCGPTVTMVIWSAAGP